MEKQNAYKMLIFLNHSLITTFFINFATINQTLTIKNEEGSIHRMLAFGYDNTSPELDCRRGKRRYQKGEHLLAIK